MCYAQLEAKKFSVMTLSSKTRYFTSAATIRQVLLVILIHLAKTLKRKEWETSEGGSNVNERKRLEVEHKK